MTTENKAETKRLMAVAGAIQALLDKRPQTAMTSLSVGQLLQLAEYADTLSALVLHKDTEIRVME